MLKFKSSQNFLSISPRKFGWMTELGIYAGDIDPAGGDGDTVTVDCQLVPMPEISSQFFAESSSTTSTAVSSVPLGLVVTEFHALLAYGNRVRGICLLNEQVSYRNANNWNSIYRNVRYWSYFFMNSPFWNVCSYYVRLVLTSLLLLIICQILKRHLWNCRFWNVCFWKIFILKFPSLSFLNVYRAWTD